MSPRPAGIVASLLLLSAAAVAAGPPEPAPDLEAARPLLLQRLEHAAGEAQSLADLDQRLADLKSRLHGTRLSIVEARRKGDRELEKSARQIELGYVAELEQLRFEAGRQRTRSDAAQAAAAAARRLVEWREAESTQAADAETLDKLARRYRTAARKAAELTARLEATGGDGEKTKR